MKQKSINTAIFLSLFFALEAHAEQNTIRLVCKYSYTIDGRHQISRMSGEDVITVKFWDNKVAKIRMQGLNAEFTGTISDEEIFGKTEYSISGNTLQQTLSINRYTGAFETIFSIKGSGTGIIYYGNCEPAAEKKF